MNIFQKIGAGGVLLSVIVLIGVILGLITPLIALKILGLIFCFIAIVSIIDIYQTLNHD